MGERGLDIRAGVNKQGWEKSDFPVLCETCLGDNPYVRMSRSEFARECKTCQRPFTVFRWKPGSKSSSESTRYKKTEICQTCAKVKNVCQTCIFDLDFGLPVELRDKFIEQNEMVVMPADPANRDFWANKMNAHIDKLDLPYNNAEVQSALGQISKKHNGDLNRGLGGSKAAKRNAAHVCSFFVKGNCNRGIACPYRHSNITDQDLESLKKGNGSIDEKIRERFNGINDPIAKKIMDKIEEKSKAPSPPEDQSISTLFLGNVTSEDITDEVVKEQMEKFGKIERMRLLHRQSCGFVCFFSREAAEKAIQTLHDKFYLCEKKIKLDWAKCQLQEQKAYRKKPGNQKGNKAAKTHDIEEKKEVPRSKGPKKSFSKKQAPVLEEKEAEDPLMAQLGERVEITEFSSILQTKGAIPRGAQSSDQ